ncbi:MAG TPA: kinase [Pseudonocardiaceae bacterium]|nr:kinase [Pseudonocardiaceae bacterium]
MRGVILYGAPATGKDTITHALHKLDARYVLFPRLKVGGGRTAGYRITSDATLRTLRAHGDIIWENHRYGATYVIDRPTLLAQLNDHIPVVHLGQHTAIGAVVRATPAARWLIVSVWCPRHVAKERLSARGTNDTATRLCAWDDTPPLPDTDVTIDTATQSPECAARRIQRHIAALAD